MSADTNIDPREGAESVVHQEMSQDSRRDYSAVAQTGLDGNSLQPNVICHDQDHLKNAAISNELPKRPCSLYFHSNVSNFDVQSLLQDVKRCGINMSSVRCAQKVSKDAYTISFKTPEEGDLFSKKSKYIER